MLAGMFLGYAFRWLTFLQKIERSIFATILTMLFMLGLSVGSNPQIVQNLAKFGGQAAILSVAGLLGSVIAARLVGQFISRRGGRKL